jgi:hypothetical protein
MLTLTQLNNQCETNLTYPLLGLFGPNHNYYKLLTGWGVTITPLPRHDALSSITHTHTYMYIYIYGKRIPRTSSRCATVSWD